MAIHSISPFLAAALPCANGLCRHEPFAGRVAAVSGGDTISVGTFRSPRTVLRDEASKLLAKRTLTNLDNQRPAWLDSIRRHFAAVFSAAYGWVPGMTDEKGLEPLVARNLERAG